jgi:hypothetical protein
VISFSRGHAADLRSAMLYGGWTPLQDACFWRRSLYERVGEIDPELRYAADYDLFLRFAMTGRTTYVPKAFSAFRRHSGQRSIAGASAYKGERAAVRRRELERAQGSALAGGLQTAWHGFAVRWRIRVSQRRWTRPDLRGTPIGALTWQAYWPPASGSTAPLAGWRAPGSCSSSIPGVSHRGRTRADVVTILARRNSSNRVSLLSVRV